MLIAPHILKALLAASLALALAACGETASTAGRAKGAHKKAKLVQDSEESDSLSEDDETEAGSEDNEDGERLTGGDGGDAEIQLPTYTLAASGYTTYNDDDHLTMTMTIQTALSEERVSVDAKAARVLCGDLGGCNQGNVDEDVNANVLGANVFETIPRDELNEMPDYEDARFAFFSKSFSHKRGISYTADKPLPINVVPGSDGRYKALDDGPMSWTARVKSSRPLPHSPGMDLDILDNLTGPALAMLAISEFTVKITVSKAEVGDGKIELTLETEIQEDKNRQLYTYFPVGRRSTYIIDTKKQDLVGVRSLGWSYGDDSKHAEETSLEHRVCAKSVGGKVKRNDCP